jgi:hypothetical protein
MVELDFSNTRPCMFVLACAPHNFLCARRSHVQGSPPPSPFPFTSIIPSAWFLKLRLSRNSSNKTAPAFFLALRAASLCLSYRAPNGFVSVEDLSPAAQPCLFTSLHRKGTTYLLLKEKCPSSKLSFLMVSDIEKWRAMRLQTYPTSQQHPSVGRTRSKHPDGLVDSRFSIDISLLFDSIHISTAKGSEYTFYKSLNTLHVNNKQVWFPRGLLACILRAFASLWKRINPLKPQLV